MDTSTPWRPPTEKKTTELEVAGWRPLVIEYGFLNKSEMYYLVWNIQSMGFDFSIPLKTVYTNHGGDFKSHFILTLECFREDYLFWREKGFPSPESEARYAGVDDLIIC